MKRAYSPREISEKTYRTLPWGGRWEEAFGQPEESSVWYVGGASASGKSSFVMQLACELTRYGKVLYLSYEEGVGKSFRDRLLRFGLDKRQGWFRVATSDTAAELADRLRRRHSAKFIIVDSIQESGWDYGEVKALLEAFPRKGFVFVSQVSRGKPMGKTAEKVLYKSGVKVSVRGFRAYCQGRYSREADNSFVVWEEGVLRTTNHL